MVNRLIAWSIRHRVLVAVLSLVLAAWGLWEGSRLPVDVLPDLNRPTVTVMTEGHGLVPIEVERLITRPLEESLNGTPGLEKIRSTSAMGLSIVNIEFGWGSDIYRNRQLVQERLSLARERLPESTFPELTPIASVMGQVRIIGLKALDNSMDPTVLRAFADKVIRPRLLSVPGVAQVVPIGSTPRQLQVLVDSDRLVQHGVTLAEVRDAISGANRVASGGMMAMGASSPLVILEGTARDPEDIAGAVVKAHPVRPVRVEDVARVVFGPALIRTGDASVDGEPGVVITVYKQPGVDTMVLDGHLDTALEELTRALPPKTAFVPALYRQADFIHRSVSNVSEAIRDGAILVVVVLVLFLLNVRTTVITLLAIPVSIALTAMWFRFLGLSINTMTLGGLAIAVGSLVDDAIVGVENVFRRLKENRAKAQPEKSADVVFRASSEVRGPVIVGTLLVCLVYVPLFALHGMEGRLFTPVGIAYVVSIAASLLVAMTMTPALCQILLPNAKATSHIEDPWLVRLLKNAAGAVVLWSLHRPAKVLGVLLGLSLAAGLVLFTRGSNFLPPFDEGAVQVNILLPPGTGLDAANEFGKRKDLLVMNTPGVQHAGRRTGRAANDAHAHAVNFSETLVTFDPAEKRTREEILGDLRQRLRTELPGVVSSAEQPIQHALSHLLSGVNAQVAVKIRGTDLDVLRRISVDVEGALKGVPGVVDLYREPQVLVPQVEVKPRREALARAGIRVEELAELIELALEGEEVSRLAADPQPYPVTLMMEEKDRADLERVRNLLLAPSQEGALRVRDLADVSIIGSPNSINRENGSRLVVVQHNVEGRSLGEIVRDVQAALAPIKQSLPAGYSIDMGGQFEAQQAAAHLMLVLSSISLALMFLVLYAHLKSMNLSLQVLAKLPPSLIGGVVLLIATGQEVSIAALVGFIALAGIVTRNGILLMDHYIQLAREGVPMSPELVVQAGRTRMAPMVMTALCSGIALVPLLLAGYSSGRELLWPVATVIVGGLITSTCFDFIFTPALFWMAGRKAALTRAKEMGALETGLEVEPVKEAEDPVKDEDER